MKSAPSSTADTTVILGTEYNEARALCAGLVEELDRSLAENNLELPSLPEVALKIRKALADENVSVTEISRLIGSDPALAARILKTANSALFYRGSKPITSVHAAVSQLGHRMVRNVALSFAAQQVFIGYGSQQLRAYLTQIWQHSVHVAALAHMLARVRTKLNPDEAFLAGLLHEVGKLYILMRAKEKLDVLASENAFQAVLAAWHPRLGRAVIELWQLPPELAAAVGDHQSCRLEQAVNDEQFFDKAPSFGALAMDKATFDWLIRAGDVDIRLLMLAFGV
jgi:HD-like signal output (HDOD) protein